MMDRGSGNYQINVNEEQDFTGFSSQKIVPELSDRQILEQLNKVQRANQIRPSGMLERRENGYNLTIEMETGVGKTYTYIKTMFELNKHYGWSKFAMIINSQAFNTRGRDARRIYMNLDEFRSRRPIDIIAKTNPVLIIDEPQSVEGKQTKERLKEFHPLLTQRYSAAYKCDSIYNMVFRLDAMEAYNRRRAEEKEPYR